MARIHTSKVDDNQDGELKQKTDLKGSDTFSHRFI